MPFPDVASARKPLYLFDHMVLIAVSALPLVAVSPPHDPAAVGLAAIMLLLGYLLWWLPGLGARGRWHDPLVLPAFMALTVVYLLLAFIAFSCDPDSAVLIIAAQLIALVYVSFRT
jgi:hypothetical protein